MCQTPDRGGRTGGRGSDQRDFDRICAEWTSYQREKSGLCDFVRIVADVSAGERDILVIYCMGAPEELIFFDDYAKISSLTVD